MSPASGNGTVRIVGTRRNPVNDDFAAFKLDHQISDNHLISGTYNFSDADRSLLGMLADVTENDEYGGNGATSKRHIVSTRYTSIVSPTVLNEFKFGFSRTPLAGDIPLSTRDTSSLAFNPIRKLVGQLDQQGRGGIFEDIGFRVNRSNYEQDVFTFNDGLSVTRGNHSLRAGVEVNRYHYDQRSCSRGCNGIYRFRSLQRFLQGRPNRIQIMVPDEQGRGLSDPHLLDQILFGAYFQDNWQLSPSFTLNLGMRYEFVTVPAGEEGNTSALVNFQDSDVTIGPPFTNPSQRSFSPRFGFAWAPGDRKTSLRGGFGIFYVHPMLYQLRTALQELPPFVQTARADDDDFEDLGLTLRFPDVFTTQFDILSDPNFARPNLRAPQYEQDTTYVYRWSLTLQREVADWILSAGYTGSRALHLWNQNRMNLNRWDGWPDNPPPGTPKQWGPEAEDRGRIQPFFSEARIQTTNANSYYQGLALGAQKRLSHGLQAQLSYTFSKAIDQGSGVTSGGDELL